MVIKRHRETITFVREEPRLSARQFFLRYILAAITFIAFFGMLAYVSSMNQAFNDDIKWKSSFFPNLPEFNDSLKNSSSETSFLVFSLGMSPEFPYLGRYRNLPTADVKSDLNVVVVGRFDYSDKKTYVLAAGTGTFNQTCVIQAGGAVTGIAHDSSAVLLSYSPPKSGKTGIGTCSGNEMFFMPWNH